MDFNDCLYTGYSFYMAAVAVIGGGCGLRIDACRTIQSNKSKLSLYSCYSHFNIAFKQLYASCKTEHFSYKVGVARVCIHVLRCYVRKKSWLRLQINGFMLLVI